MNAIPTVYGGVQFRSRLEAKWAAFFDIIDWQWEYEPIDLNGYIPDFILDGEYLVEVKPITKWPCAAVGCTKCNDTPRAEHDAAIAKIEQSGWAGSHALIVGAAVFRSRIDVGRLSFPCLGRVVQSDTWLRGFGFNFMRHDLVAEWREAGNRVQWRSPRQSHVASRHGRPDGNDTSTTSMRNWLLGVDAPDDHLQISDEPDLSIWKFDPETDIP